MRHHPATTPRPLAATCRGVIADVSPLPSIDWRVPDPADASVSSTWCATVGPAVVMANPVHAAQAEAIDDIAVVSWNTHVGGGDVPAFVSALQRGELTLGRPVREFVLLLQEVFREGPAVPSEPVRGAPVPGRIEEHPPTGIRRDIVSTAESLGLALYYVPSMRNGRAGLEDRGNAILSTMPLSAFGAIELPFESQRRVAITADVGGFHTDGTPWQLRVASLHLDASASAKRLWVFASGARERQARGLIDALDLDLDRTPTVLGSDLNTWAGGPREPAYLTLRESFPQTANPGMHATFRAGLMLDYIFFRVPQEWRSESQRSRDRFGSDHHPLVGSLSISALGRL